MSLSLRAIIPTILPFLFLATSLHAQEFVSTEGEFTLNDTLGVYAKVPFDSLAPVYERDDCDTEPISGGCPRCEYPKEAIDQKLQGDVVVKILLTSTGHIKQIQISRSTNKIFNRVALTAASHMVFIPAKKNGKQVNTWVNYPFRFRLPKETQKRGT